MKICLFHYNTVAGLLMEMWFPPEYLHFQEDRHRIGAPVYQSVSPWWKSISRCYSGLTRVKQRN